MATLRSFANASTEGALDVPTVRARTLRDLRSYQMRFPLRSVVVDGLQWMYRRTPGRDASQTPMLLLPGIQGGADVFFEVGLALADEIPMVAASAPDIEDVLQMTRALAGFVSTIKAPRAHFLGSSLGGYLVQSLALLRPDLIDQLIIANGFFDASATQAFMPPFSALAQMDAEVLVRQNLKSLMDGPDADPGHVALKAAIAGLVGPTQTAENYKSRVLLLMRAKPLATPAVRAECIMLIDDEEDPMVPPSMRNALRARFAHSEAHAIKGGGHLPAIQRAGDFIKLLRDRLCADRS